MSSMGNGSRRKLATTSIITTFWTSTHIEMVETLRTAIDEISTKPRLLEELSSTHASTTRCTMTPTFSTSLDASIIQRSILTGTSIEETALNGTRSLRVVLTSSTKTFEETLMTIIT